MDRLPVEILQIILSSAVEGHNCFSLAVVSKSWQQSLDTMAIYIYSFWNEYSRSIKVACLKPPRRNIDYVVYYGSAYNIERLRGKAIFYRREYYSMSPDDLNRIIENTDGLNTAENFDVCPFNNYNRRITLYTQYNINFQDKYLLYTFRSYMYTSRSYRTVTDPDKISRLLFIYLALDRLFEIYTAELRSAQIIEQRYKRLQLYRAILNHKTTQAPKMPMYMSEN